MTEAVVNGENFLDEKSRLLRSHVYPEDQSNFSTEISATRYQRSKWFTVGIPVKLALTVLVFFSIMFLGHSSFRGKAALQLSASTPTSDPPVVLEISNDYPPLHDSTKMYGWEFIVEPYRRTTLTIRSTNSDPSTKHQWTVFLDENPHEHVEIEDNGQSVVQAMFTKPGRFYHVHIEESDSNGNTNVFKYKVICKYVRREIRSLHEEDREKYFSALEAYHRLSMEEGQQLYGMTFHNAKDLTIRHLAVIEDCSPWHGGANFVPTHFAFVAHLEQVLQLIEPSISIPYWNYVLDSHQYGPEWAKSEVFSDDYFGAYTDSATGKLEGRWGSVPIGRVTQPSELNTFHNSYGVITGEHNQDNHFFLTRSTTTCGWAFQQLTPPGCDEEQAVLEQPGFETFYQKVDGKLHAILHPLLGGAWYCDYDAVGAMEALEGDEQAQLALETILISTANNWEQAYDYGFYSSPPSFGVLNDDSPFEEARITLKDIECSDVDTMEFDEVYKHLDEMSYLVSSNEYFNWFDTANFTDDGIFQFKNVDSIKNEFLMRAMLKILCSAGGLSPMSSPLGSSADPLFAATHSLYNRHWSYLRLANPDWDATFYEGTQTCYGFNADDVMVWQGFLGEEGDDLHFYTQQELLDIFSPSNAALPYMHDSLDFSYCSG